MKRIILLCAVGMSTSLLVTKMEEAAKKEGLDYKIEAFSVTEAMKVCKEADAILLGPQVRFELGKMKETYPDKPIESIDTVAYGTMDGPKVIRQVKKMVGDQ